MSNSKSKILLIGIGNEYRSDDGIGLVVARKLKEKRLPKRIVVEEVVRETALMETWKGSDRVIIVDAASSGAEPGIIHRFDACAGPIPVGMDGHSPLRSTHTFSIAETIELARTLNQLPPHLIVYGIEGKTFKLGLGLSLEVEMAGEEVVERVLQEVRSIQVGTKHSSED
jgi:hydrogenase maturation protease